MNFGEIYDLFDPIGLEGRKFQTMLGVVDYFLTLTCY